MTVLLKKINSNGTEISESVDGTGTEFPSFGENPQKCIKWGNSYF